MARTGASSHRSDLNQLAISGALMECGCLVQSLSGVGVGCPDLLVGVGGDLILIETKNPEGRGTELTEPQKKFHRTWKGYPIFKACSPEESLDVIRQWRRLNGTTSHA